MCSALSKNTRGIAAGFCLLAGAMSVGCGQPQGVLFPVLEPPRIWPPPPETPRIKLLGTISGSTDLKAARSGMEAIKTAFRGKRPPIKFSGPHSVAVRALDLVAVADAAGGAVHLIDLRARTHRLVAGFGEERFGIPVGVAWAGDRLFVTDALRGEVIELDPQGAFRQRFGGGALTRPVGITYVPPRERLYVVDGSAHCLTLFDLDGTDTATIGGRGSGPGELNFPTHIAWAGNRLLVADSGNFRVQLLDLDGVWIGTIGRKGDGAGDLSLPKGVAFDSEGHLYVADAHFENVQVFDDSGRLLLAFGREGTEPGKFSLPAGLAIDAHDRIWVADSGNRRLQVFEYMRKPS